MVGDVIPVMKMRPTADREAAAVANAERGYDVDEVGDPIPNPVRKAGRPSLSPEGGTSKALNARIPSGLHGEVVAFAERTGRSVSDLTRDALAALIAAEERTPRPSAARRTRAVPGTKPVKRKAG